MSEHNYHTAGSKYAEVENLDITEIAKLIRKDIKNELPAIKASVKIERYSMGQSIDVVAWTDVPIYVVGRDLNSNGQRLYDKLKEIVDAYNFNDSDSMTDYFHVNFYGGVRLLETGERP